MKKQPRRTETTQRPTKLELRKQSLLPLGTAELDAVRGGGSTPFQSTHDTIVYD